jgi:VWFA-related protein
MTKTFPKALSLAAALAASLPALPAAAQTGPEETQPRQQQPQRLLSELGQPGEPAGIFLESLDVEIVNLDVMVSDSRGNPIDGLTREDFRLKVDGRPTPIDNFYVIGPGTASAAAAAAESVPAPGAPAPEPEGAATLPPPEQELHVLILFDNFYATPGERKRVVDELAAHFEDGLGVRGRAAVGYYDGGIRVRQPFTSDGAAVAAAIRETAERQVRYGDDLERRNLLREIEQVRFGAPMMDSEGNRRSFGDRSPSRAEDGRAAQDAAGLLMSIQMYAEQQAVQVRNRISALTWKVETLAGLPGRKALLYVSSGLDLRPGQALFSAWQNKFGALGRVPGQVSPVAQASNLEVAAGGPDLDAALRDLIHGANAGGVALYAIGTAGTGTSHSISAEYGGFELETISTSTANFTLDQGLDVQLRANLGSGLERMAADTGGEALTGGADYDRIADQIETDAGHRYSLGFRAPEGEPGTRYRVEVEVPRWDVKLRYRNAFVTATPVQRASERTRAALLWDRADNGLGIVAVVGPAQPSERGKGLLMQPVMVKVPFANLVLVPEQQFHRGRITIFVVAQDEAGRLSPVQTIEAPIQVPADRLDEVLRGVAGYRIALVVRPGAHRLAIGVRDEIGDVVSALVVDHDVTAPPEEG